MFPSQVRTLAICSLNINSSWFLLLFLFNVDGVYSFIIILVLVFVVIEHSINLLLRIPSIIQCPLHLKGSCCTLTVVFCILHRITRCVRVDVRNKFVIFEPSMLFTKPLQNSIRQDFVFVCIQAPKACGRYNFVRICQS